MKKTKKRSSRQQCQPKKKDITSKNTLTLICLFTITLSWSWNKIRQIIMVNQLMAPSVKPTAPFLTKDMAKYHLWKLNKIEKERGGADYAQTDLLYPSSSSTTTASATYLHVDASTISTLTNDHEDSMEGIREEPSTTVGNNALVSSITTTASALIANNAGTRTCEGVVVGVVMQHVNEDTSHRNSVVGVFGRPKGSTQANSREVKERLRLAIAWAAGEYDIVRRNGKKNNKRAPR